MCTSARGSPEKFAADKISEFERAYLDHIADSHPEVAEQIMSAEKGIPEETQAVLNQAIETIKAQL